MGAALPYLIWDYDGTLHETMRVYKPAIAAVVQWLRDEHGVPVEMPSDARISSWLGMSTAAMWEDFAPQLPEPLKKEAGAYVGQRMKEETLAGHGGWYPGAARMLDGLKAAGYSMAVLSNCDAAYAALNWEVWGMERWFDTFYDCGSFGFISKADVLERISGELRHDRGFVVIGDRASDLEMARRVGARFIWCAYGYGTREEMAGCGFDGESVAAAIELGKMIQKDFW